MLDRQKILNLLKKNGYKCFLNGEGIITEHSSLGTPFNIEGSGIEALAFSLPKFYLLERRKFKHLAHVGWDNENDKGIICEGVEINRHLDYANPEAIYLKALMNAEKTVQKCLSDKIHNESEIIQEFSAHWRFSTQKKNTILSFVEHHDEIIELQSIRKEKSEWATALDVYKNGEINDQYLFRQKRKDEAQSFGKSFYVPIKDRILPPDPTTSIMEWWIEVLNKMPSASAKILEQLATRHRAKNLWLLGSTPLYDNKIGWFCIKFETTHKSVLPFRRDCNFDKWTATAYNVELHNKTHLKPRGGASNFNTLPIAIVGCGSVGAEIARQLVCSGVENIEFVDFEKLETSNIYRHTLSSEYIGKEKSAALCIDLSTKYPYVKLKTSPKRRLLECAESEYLESISGIIIATGSPTDERAFNEALMKIKSRPWAIFAWVEGHGFGGHAIYVHKSGQGCLSCLYHDQNGEKSLESIQNFIKSDQSISIDLSGCGSHFLPYSYADAIQSALLATRLATLAIDGKLTKSCRMSWKTSFASNSGIETSYRFKHFNNSLNIEDLFWEHCDVCSH